MSALRMDAPAERRQAPTSRRADQRMLATRSAACSSRTATSSGCPVAEVARMLRLLTFSGSHPLITDGNPLTAEEIVSVLLDGVLRRPNRATSTRGNRC